MIIALANGCGSTASTVVNPQQDPSAELPYEDTELASQPAAGYISMVQRCLLLQLMDGIHTS